MQPKSRSLIDQNELQTGNSPEPKILLNWTWIIDAHLQLAKVDYQISLLVLYNESMQVPFT